MKATKLITIFFFIFIAFSMNVIAYDNYTTLGGNNDFHLGVGFWNSGRSDDCSSGEILCTTKNIASPSFIPLVADLDGNGNNEIIVFDGATTRLYRDSSLSVVDAFTSALISSVVNALVYDIDADGYNEIIIVDTRDIQILEYNGTEIYNQTNIVNALSGTTASTPQVLINCEDANKCLALYEEKDAGCTPCTLDILATSFNSTQNITTGKSVYTSANNNNPCLSAFGYLGVEDIDNDAVNEYVFSVGDNNGDKVNLRSVYLNGTNYPIVDDSVDITDAVISSSTCDDVGFEFTNPLSYNFDGSTSNGLESVIGFLVGSDDFKMHIYDGALNFIDDYPEILNSEGILMSNPFLIDAYTDTGRTDFCVLGYENAVEELTLLCGSLLTGEIPTANEFTFDTSNYYNVSEGYHLIVHSTEQDSILTSGHNLDEIITSYGIFSLDFVGINNLILEWENPKPDAFVMNIDAEKLNVDDILLLTSTNLWYIDDLFTNRNANVSRITTNPSILSIIKINESVVVTIKCDDADLDNVMARLVSYVGDTNQQETNTTLGASGTTFSLTFEANKTISNGDITFGCRDVNHTEYNNVTLPFSVGLNGISFGDATYDSGDLTTTTTESTGEGGTNQTATDNSFRDGILDLCNSMRVTPTMFMFLLMIFMSIGLIFLLASKDGGGFSTEEIKLGIIVSIIANIFILMFFTYMRLISGAWLVSLMFLMIVGIVLFVYTKSKTGNGL